MGINFARFVPRLKRRTKMPDYSDRNVFGIPIAVTQQRHGQPLPQCILYAMRYLRRSASESIGLFRKSGVRSRVQALRISLDSDAGKTSNVPSYPLADVIISWMLSSSCFHNLEVTWGRQEHLVSLCNGSMVQTALITHFILRFFMFLE